jgi:hypothetical protein
VSVSYNKKTATRTVHTFLELSPSSSSLSPSSTSLSLASTSLPEL